MGEAGGRVFGGSKRLEGAAGEAEGEAEAAGKHEKPPPQLLLPVRLFILLSPLLEKHPCHQHGRRQRRCFNDRWRSMARYSRSSHPLL